MARVRISTTVDAELIAEARRVRGSQSDAKILDEALAVLVESGRAAEIDSRYSGYEEHPLDKPDEWGDLASFLGEATWS